jgi:SRSO17 transposase
VECVVFDAHYGYNQDFLYELIKRKIPFVGDVRGKFSIYLSKPAMKVPKQTGRGRKFYKERPDRKPVLISKYTEHLNPNDFKSLTVRSGTKQAIHARYHLRKVWMHYKPQNCLIELHLLIQKRADGEIKYSLAFFSDQKISMLKIAKAQAQRVFIERIFEEGKNIVGMADYQVRSWTGFHRHMSLCSLALLFLMEQKINLKKFIGKITAYQIQQLLNATSNQSIH